MMSLDLTHKRHRTTLGLFATATLWLAGCALETGTFDTESTARNQEFRCVDPNGNISNDPACPWKTLTRLATTPPENDISHTKSPALCAGSNAMAVSVDTVNRYRTLAWHYTSASSWGAYGSRTFSSRPACAMREADPATGRPAFVLAGKGTDNKIYTSPGVMPVVGNPQVGNPTPVAGTDGEWKAISTTTYTTGGGPALAVGSYDGAQKIVLVHMGDNGRIYARTRSVPYMQSAWSAQITGPLLPTGWNAVGAPSIARLPVTFQIVLHARSTDGTQDRLFQTYFYIGQSQHFSNEIGSPASVWTMLPNVGRIDDEPALTYHNTHGSTVYFRRFNPAPGSQTSDIMQMSGHPLGSIAPLAIKKTGVTMDFEGSPAALANWTFESASGTHYVLARNKVKVGGTEYHRMAYANTMMDSTLVP
jgi:hypothetical protein